MPLEHVELLKTQRDLHDISRGMERFWEYLRVMIGGTDDILLPPLGVMNPMGREHVAERLDELMDIGAEEVAAQAVRDVEQRLLRMDERFKHGLVIADDLRGGWTNRH
jgi:hypothetical protein